MNSITSKSIPNPSTDVQETQNPKQIQGETLINGKTLSVKLMDDSFSQKNTTDKKLTFLHDAKHLHQRREVHEKGIFHANYEGKGFFGSIGQFFKNIKLSFEKNDINELKNALDKEYAKYASLYSSIKLSKNETMEDKMNRMKQLQQDASKIENTLRLMIIKGSGSLPKDSLVLSAADKFASLDKEMGKEIKRTINPQNK